MIFIDKKNKKINKKYVLMLKCQVISPPPAQVSQLTDTTLRWLREKAVAT